MTKIAIINHKNYGYNNIIAECIALGCRQVISEVKLYTAAEAIIALDEMKNIDALIIGSPTYFGSVSAEVKAFMDATSKIWLKQRWRNKIAAAFTCANSSSGDQLGTLIQILTYALQHGMIWVGLDLMPKLAEYTSEAIFNGLGCWIGYTAQVRNIDGNKTLLSKNDLKAAEYFGKRVAQISQSMNLKGNI